MYLKKFDVHFYFIFHLRELSHDNTYSSETLYLMPIQCFIIWIFCAHFYYFCCLAVLNNSMSSIFVYEVLFICLIISLG